MKSKTILLLLFYIYNAYSSEFSSCKLFDSNKKLLKCTQVSKGYSRVVQRFKKKCLTSSKKGLSSKFFEYSGCPQKGSLYQCKALKFYEKTSESSYFYYHLSDNSKLKARCFNSKKRWVDLDSNSKDNLLMKKKFKFASCLKIENRNKLYCETRKILSAKQLQNFYYSCQINHTSGRYYQFLKDKDCPSDDIKYSCHDDNHNFNIYYKDYLLYTKKELSKYCRELKKKWGSSKSSTYDLSDIGWGSCSIIKEGKVVYCDEMLNENQQEFKKFYNTCEQDGSRIIWNANSRCPKEGSTFVCLDKKSTKRNRILYNKDKKRISKLKSLCSYLKLTWESI